MVNHLYVLIVLLLINTSYLMLENEKYDLILDCDISYEDKIGISSNFVLETNSSDPYKIFANSDIEEQSFETKLRTKNTVEIGIKCNLWKPIKNNLLIICNAKEDPKVMKYDNEAKLVEYIMKYKGKTIKIYSSKYLKFNYINYNYPFLYADNQTIYLNDKSEIYEIKFKVGSYYDKNIYLYDVYNFHKFYIHLDNCKVEKNEMICYLSKEKIESFGAIVADDYETQLNVLTFDFEYGLRKFYMADTITIENKYVEQKESIYVQITKLLGNIYESENYIAYETNITNFNNIESSYFILNFTKINSTEEFKQECILKKLIMIFH